MRHVIGILKVRPGEERIFWLLVGLMTFTAAGSAIGGSATEALFFDRFGVDLLPEMYIVLGVLNFATSIAITALMGRTSKQHLYVILPLVLATVLIVEWLVIPLGLRWFFALMWLGMMVINSLQGLVTWGLAGAACDTRQAKRLFPLFSAGGIIGTIVGGLVTQPLAARLHSENLVLLWAGALFIASGLGHVLTRKTPDVHRLSHTLQPSLMEEMQRGYRFVRGSSILRKISYSAILFSVCYFSLTLPFARNATTEFPDADQLAGFLGLFQSLSTGAALLISLFLTNRLFTRIGVMPTLLIFPMIYMAGFGVLAYSASFWILVGVRFAQMAYMNGAAGASWQAVFNVVPPEQRDQVRAFVSGVPEQGGTFIAGLILLVGEQALQTRQLYLVGFFTAGLLVYTVWRAGQSYRYALVEALRAGQPHVFSNEDLSFGGQRIDAEAVAVVLSGLKYPDARIRRVSSEILGHLPVPEAPAALVDAVQDEDAAVRVYALKGLAQLKAASALLEISTSLSDPEPEVRYQAVTALEQLAGSPRGIVTYISPLLLDADAAVRAQAAQTLLCANGYEQARQMLHAMALDPDPHLRARALVAFGECQDETGFDLAVSALHDPQLMVREAAARAVMGINPQAGVSHLIHHLDDNDPAVRCALADSLGKAGEAAIEPLLETLCYPSYEEGALMAFAHLPVQKAETKIRDYAKNVVQAALHYHHLAIGLARHYATELPQNAALQLLVESVQDQRVRSGLNALRALALVSERETIAIAIENLQSRETVQRANAIETLEAMGEREIIRPLLAIWETGGSDTAALPENWLPVLLGDPSSWLRACAVLVAGMCLGKRALNDLAQISAAVALPLTGETQASEMNEKLSLMCYDDPDDMVRAAAQNALVGDMAMETLTTLSLMERILFLRRVSLFSDLPPADMKQVAEISREVYFTDGQILAHQNESGTEMYIVVTGEVSVMVTNGYQDGGREVARCRSGDYVGEMSIISQEPRTATLIAVGTVRALCLKQKPFETMLRERPEISLAVMRNLCQRLKEANERVSL